jgi:hypothetical protein
MIQKWEERSLITANLLNPAFCGEVIRRTILSYNTTNEISKFPFSLSFIVLPLVLHKKTRGHMPRSTATYFHSWIEEHEFLLIDFSSRTEQLLPYTKEALLFLYHYRAIEIGANEITVTNNKKKSINDEHAQEVNDIYKKAEFLGKWMKQTGNEQTIYMFLKIQP